MCRFIQKLAYKTVLTLSVASAAAFPAFAGMDNPLTGDTQGRYMGVVIAVMAVALVVIVILAVTSSKKKK